MPKTTVLTIVLLLMLNAAPAFAQGGVVPEPSVTEEQGDNSPDGGFDWGWLGLIGLVGLAGLVGRRR